MTPIECPHCHEPMRRWNTPTFNFSDGLGFCTPWLWICFNDECKYFVRSWEHMKKSYGQKLGYRFMIHPDSHESGGIPVGSPIALRGDIIDEREEERRLQLEPERGAIMEKIHEHEKMIEMWKQHLKEKGL